MRSRQIAERLGVEEAHMLEFQQFNIVWDKKMVDYEHHAEDMVFSMRVSTTKPILSTKHSAQNNIVFDIGGLRSAELLIPALSVLLQNLLI